MGVATSIEQLRVRIEALEVHERALRKRVGDVEQTADLVDQRTERLMDAEQLRHRASFWDKLRSWRP